MEKRFEVINGNYLSIPDTDDSSFNGGFAGSLYDLDTYIALIEGSVIVAEAISRG